MIEHRERLKVRHHECGFGGILKLKDLLDYLQDVAGDHADELGVGLATLREQRELWVLSRLKLALSRPLRLGEEVELVTYPSGIELLFATRQYTLRVAGEDVGQATSYWLLLDAASFRPVRPQDCLPPVLRDLEEVPHHFRDLGKIRRQACTGERQPVVIRRTDIDENNHLNNAQYGRCIADVAAELTGSEALFRELQINYNHQVLLGDTLYCGGCVSDNGDIYVDGVSADGGVSYFQACGKLFAAEELKG